MSEQTFKIWRSAVSDRSAFEQWYREINSELLLQIHRMVGGDLGLAEDLLHDVVVRFLERGMVKKISAESSVKAYLFVSARNRYLDHLRRAKVANQSSQEVTELSDNITPFDELLLQERLDRLETELSVEEKATLQRMIDGKKLSEIASEEELSYSNAGVKVHRIRNKINYLINK